ncbi:TRAP transporter small permease [Peptoniphilaceae bacterium SGI.137]
MKKFQKLKIFFNIVNRIEDFLLVVFVAGMIFTILIQIIGRIVGHPFPWTEEVSRYLFLWMMFVALAAGFNRVESSRVTIFVKKLPKTLRKLIPILYSIFVIGLFLFMVIYGSEVVSQQIAMNERGTAVQIPMALIGICQPVAGVLGIIGVIQSFIEYPDRIAAIDDRDQELRELEEQMEGGTK